MSCASWEVVNSEETVFSKPGIFTHLAYPYNGWRKLKEKGYIYFKWDMKSTDMFPRIAEDSCVRDCEFPEDMDFELLDWSEYPEDWKDKILK